MGRQRRFHFSIKYSIGGAMVGAVLFTALLIGTVAYLSIRVFIFDDIRARLRSAVGIAALQIDAGSTRPSRARKTRAGKATSGSSASCRISGNRTRTCASSTP